MQDGVIVDAVRKPFGDRDGAFRDTHPQDLAAEPLQALEERVGSAQQPSKTSYTGASRRWASRD
ncbi:MAG: acetyl-CoA acetyltransferase [Halobacteriales archaeon]|jgi:acetyl-CoA acetyltransferase